MASQYLTSFGGKKEKQDGSVYKDLFQEQSSKFPGVILFLETKHKD